MTFRIIAVEGNRGRLAFRASLDDAMAEVEAQAQRLTAPDDYVRLSLDRDEEAVLEVLNG